jgi:hypothetical protein
MSVRITGEVIRVEGVGAVADAEPILAALQEGPDRTVDLSGTTRLHSAIVQLLLACRPRIVGAPADPFYVTHIATLLDTVEGSA